MGLVCLPDISKRPSALKVNLGLWFVAGGLPSVRVGGHAVETDLVAPGHNKSREIITSRDTNYGS